MYKFLITCISLFALCTTTLFGAIQLPFRSDALDYTSLSSHIKLSRAEHILGTLVPDPQSYQLILSNNPSFGGEAIPPHALTDKPGIIIYQGALSPSRSSEELAFMMAHELGHLNLHHNEKMSQRMDSIYNGPLMGISGTIMVPFHQKCEERQADLFGLHLYKNAGYNLDFFPHTLTLININPNIHFGSTHPFTTQLSSLSMKNSHFSIKERFELLTHESKLL